MPCRIGGRPALIRCALLTTPERQVGQSSTGCQEADVGAVPDGDQLGPRQPQIASSKDSYETLTKTFVYHLEIRRCEADLVRVVQTQRETP